MNTHSIVHECQGTPFSKQAQYLKFKWLQRDSNPQPLNHFSKLTTSTKRLSARLQTKWFEFRRSFLFSYYRIFVNANFSV